MATEGAEDAAWQSTDWNAACDRCWRVTMKSCLRRRCQLLRASTSEWLISALRLPLARCVLAVRSVEEQQAAAAVSSCGVRFGLVVATGLSRSVLLCTRAQLYHSTKRCSSHSAQSSYIRLLVTLTVRCCCCPVYIAIIMADTQPCSTSQHWPRAVHHTHTAPHSPTAVCPVVSDCQPQFDGWSVLLLLLTVLVLSVVVVQQIVSVMR